VEAKEEEDSEFIHAAVSHCKYGVTDIYFFRYLLGQLDEEVKQTGRWSIRRLVICPLFRHLFTVLHNQPISYTVYQLVCNLDIFLIQVVN
jgi:hypothetical protein